MTGRSTILVVEDGPTTRDLMADVLGMSGYSVITATNGKDAMKRLEVSDPQLILLDLRMPVMNGWEFLKEKSSHPQLVKIPVIVLSALAEEEAKSVWEYPCVKRVLFKGIEVETLLAEVASVIRDDEIAKKDTALDKSEETGDDGEV